MRNRMFGILFTLLLTTFMVGCGEATASPSTDTGVKADTGAEGGQTVVVEDTALEGVTEEVFIDSLSLVGTNGSEAVTVYTEGAFDPGGEYVEDTATGEGPRLGDEVTLKVTGFVSGNTLGEGGGLYKFCLNGEQLHEVPRGDTLLLDASYLHGEISRASKAAHPTGRLRGDSGCLDITPEFEQTGGATGFFQTATAENST